MAVLPKQSMLFPAAAEDLMRRALLVSHTSAFWGQAQLYVGLSGKSDWNWSNSDIASQVSEPTYWTGYSRKVVQGVEGTSGWQLRTTGTGDSTMRYWETADLVQWAYSGSGQTGYLLSAFLSTAPQADSGGQLLAAALFREIGQLEKPGDILRFRFGFIVPWRVYW